MCTLVHKQNIFTFVKFSSVFGGKYVVRAAVVVVVVVVVAASARTKGKAGGGEERRRRDMNKKRGQQCENPVVAYCAGPPSGGCALGLLLVQK